MQQWPKSKARLDKNKDRMTIEQRPNDQKRKTDVFFLQTTKVRLQQKFGYDKSSVTTKVRLRTTKVRLQLKFGYNNSTVTTKVRLQKQFGYNKSSVTECFALKFMNELGAFHWRCFILFICDFFFAWKARKHSIKFECISCNNNTTESTSMNMMNS